MSLECFSVAQVHQLRCRRLPCRWHADILVHLSMTTFSSSRHDGSSIRPPPAVGAERDDLYLIGSVEISKQMPLSARVNPLNQDFVPRPLPDDIDDHFALPRALVAGRALRPMSGATKGLCAARLRRLDNIKDAHRRGAAKVGLSAQLNLSAMVLEKANTEEPRGSSAAVDSHCAQAAERGTDMRPYAAACIKTASLCFRCQKARPVIATPPPAPIKVHAKTISLARLPRGFDEIVDAVRDLWEVGDAKNVALKTLVQDSSKRLSWPSSTRLAGRRRPWCLSVARLQMPPRYWEGGMTCACGFDGSALIAFSVARHLATMRCRCFVPPSCASRVEDYVVA